MTIPFDYTLSSLFGFFLVLTRVIGFFLAAPVFSQKEIIPQSKISLALGITLCIYPTVQDRLPVVGEHITLFSYFFVLELLLGFFIGLVCKALFMVLEFLGAIIGIQTGLSNAMVFNPALGTQTILPAMMLTLTGTLLILTTNMHHIMLSGVVQSYYIFDLNNPNLLHDIDATILSTVQHLFEVGLKFSFPFILVGLILNFSLGLINKVVPQIHVFHTIMTSQVGVGLLVLVTTITGILWGFTDFFKSEMNEIFKGIG